MPRPVPVKIIILCWGDERIDWWRGDANDDAVLTWAMTVMSDNSITPAQAADWEVLVRWSTEHALAVVSADHQDGIPTFDRDLDEADAEDREMIAHSDRLTQALHGRQLPAAVDHIEDMEKLIAELRVTLLAHGAMASVKAIDDLLGEPEGSA